MNKEYYFKSLYPFQDEILKLIGSLDTEFYLTGGTAVSRGYLNHRFSDDLDLFVNDNEDFLLFGDRIINGLNLVKNWNCNVILKEKRFIRFFLTNKELMIKIELINDVPSHVGGIKNHDNLGRLDSAKNILSNKISALVSREEPKDIADIWGFCIYQNLSIQDAIYSAHSKAAGIFEADIARVLCSVKKSDWQAVKWINPPDVGKYINDLITLGEGLVL